MRIMVTGAAGFIGFHTAIELLERGHFVLGVDNLNDYYDPRLKQARLDILLKNRGFKFVKLDLSDRAGTERLFADAMLQDGAEESPTSGKQLSGVQGDQVVPLTPALSRMERETAALNPIPGPGAPRFDAVVHLAAQAGVRYSITNPHVYVDSNLQAFVNVLEGCRHNGINHLVYASSSSVYGGNTKLPFAESDRVDTPVSLYAATKKANELMAHTYSHLYGLRTTGLRFFTVYGPWGRPDMAMFLFTKAILEGKEIDVFGHGQMWRDFTYVDDIVDGILRIVEGRRPSDPGLVEDASPAANHPPASRKAGTVKPETAAAGQSLTPALSRGEREDAAGPRPPTLPYRESACSDIRDQDRGKSNDLYRIYNIGHNKPEYLMDLISILENELCKKARIRFLPMQPGDVPKTYADIDAIKRDFGFEPKTALKEGVKRFVKWYREYHFDIRSPLEIGHGEDDEI